MTDEQSNYGDEHAEPAEHEQAVTMDSMTKDQERIAQWQAAAETVASQDDMRVMRDEVEQAREMLAAAEAKYAESAARRACVYGFARVADEEGVTAKMLHSWQREHASDSVNLSSVPVKEMVREQRRIEAERQRIEELSIIQQQVADREARLAQARKGLDR